MRNNSTVYLPLPEPAARVTQTRLFNNRYLVALDENRKATVWDARQTTRGFPVLAEHGTLSAKSDLCWYASLQQLVEENEGSLEVVQAPPSNHEYIGIARCNSSLFVGVTTDYLVWAMTSGEVVTRRKIEGDRKALCVATDGELVCIGVGGKEPHVLVYNAVETTLLKTFPLSASPKCLEVAGSMLAVQYDTAGVSVIRMDDGTETNNFHLFEGDEPTGNPSEDKARFFEGCRVNGKLLKVQDDVFELDAQCLDCQEMPLHGLIVAVSEVGTVFSFDRSSQKVVNMRRKAVDMCHPLRLFVSGKYVFACTGEVITVLDVAGLVQLEPRLVLTHPGQEVKYVKAEEVDPAAGELLVSVQLSNGSKCAYGFVNPPA